MHHADRTFHSLAQLYPVFYLFLNHELAGFITAERPRLAVTRVLYCVRGSSLEYANTGLETALANFTFIPSPPHSCGMRECSSRSSHSPPTHCARPLRRPQSIKQGSRTTTTLAISRAPRCAPRLQPSRPRDGEMQQWPSGRVNSGWQAWDNAAAGKTRDWKAHEGRLLDRFYFTGKSDVANARGVCDKCPRRCYADCDQAAAPAEAAHGNHGYCGACDLMRAFVNCWRHRGQQMRAGAAGWVLRGECVDAPLLVCGTVPSILPSRAASYTTTSADLPSYSALPTYANDHTSL